MATVPRFDPTNLDLTDFDVSAMLDSDAGRVARRAVEIAAVSAREMTYVTVGLTLLGLNQLEQRRRAATRRLHR